MPIAETKRLVTSSGQRPLLKWINSLRGTSVSCIQRQSSVSIDHLGLRTSRTPVGRELTLSWHNVWLCCVLVIVVATTYPWTHFGSHAQWDRVVWIPFQMWHSLDVLANIALYVPFGFLYFQPRLCVRTDGVVKVAVLALLLSISCEFYQVFNNSRWPSMTDVTANTVGGVIGALIAGKLRVSRVVIDK